MKLIYLKTLLITALLIIGCNKYYYGDDKLPDCGFTSGCKVNLNIKTDSTLITRSGSLKDDITGYIVLIYDTAGVLKFSGSFQVTESVTAIVPKGCYTFAVVANCSLSDLSQYSSLDNLLCCDTKAGNGVNEDMIYSGVVSTTINEDNQEIDLTLKRVAAKITFVFDKSTLNSNVSLNVTRIELINVPSGVKLFSANSPAETDITPQGDIITENLEPASHESATPLFMFENLQGTSGNIAGASQKIPDANPGCCTYARIRAEYSSPDKTGIVLYRLYLGENSVNDFNIFRETHYRESIRFSGTAISELSWRVDLSQLSDVKYLVNALPNPAEGGTVSGSGYYNYGVLPALTATPSIGYTFRGWSPEISPVVSDMTYTANFSLVNTGVAVTGISLNSSLIRLDIGDNYFVQAVISPENATNKGVIWSSSNEEIASIDSETGEICAINSGSTVITAQSADGGYTSQMVAEVYNPVNIEVKIHETFEYDQTTGRITNCVLILYARAVMDAPSDMAIVSTISPIATINVNYSYSDKGIVKNGTTTLTLNNLNNNDYPWNGVEGYSEIFSFTTPSTQEEIIESINSFTFSVIPAERYVGHYHVRW